MSNIPTNKTILSPVLVSDPEFIAAVQYKYSLRGSGVFKDEYGTPYLSFPSFDSDVIQLAYEEYLAGQLGVTLPGFTRHRDGSLDEWLIYLDSIDNMQAALINGSLE